MSASNVRRVFFGAVISATGIALAAPFSQPDLAAASPAATVYAAGSTGVVAPSHAAPAAAGRATAHAQRGIRVAPRTAAASSLAGAPSAAVATASVSSSLMQNFNGTSSNDSARTNFNQEFEPPDQGLCVGNGYVLEPVNSAFRIFKTNGQTLVGPSNVNDLFDQGSTQFTSDPRCYYDRTTNTWFATILFLSGGEVPDGKSSQLDIAVNASGNPENIWTQYQIDTTDASGNGCPCFGDQPTLGIDQDNLYVTTNEFSILGPQFNGAQIYAFSKKDLVAGNPLHFARFANLSIGGSAAASVQPAVSTGSPSAEFFLNSLDPTGTTDNRLGVWAMTNRTALQLGKLPTLSSTVITSETYGLPPASTQKGSTSTIDSGDDRMQQTQYINGTLWGELTSVVTIAHDSTNRAGAAWFSVRPSLSGGHIGAAVIKHQGYVVQAGNNVIYPALESLPSGNAAMVFTVTGANHYPSAAYAVLGAGQSAFGAIKIAAAGTGPYAPTSTRWGDYSWAVIDPAARAVWLATEYVPPLSSQTPDRLSNWGTRVLEVAVG
ncbi:MAG TPA: hypothetical protein VND54_14110 [Candidatus Saccharimonadales bacterium]|nr:hypothetical protein [Candidatus Saccharimonadales bacterium]